MGCFLKEKGSDMTATDPLSADRDFLANLRKQQAIAELKCLKEDALKDQIVMPLFKKKRPEVHER